ncbi:hypothetical protein [Bacillus sp. 1P06AnD]|uniref:hypothetical protein n=1 Tax=Bacillus sp. 1P06AnD TaxID=3132208 RepID=UPI0039A0F259
MKITKVGFIVTLIFSLLFTFIPYNSKTYAESNPVIDQYISVISVTKNKDLSITAKYKIKKNFKPGSSQTAVNISIGYSWPTTYRLNNSYNAYKAVKSTKGTYTVTIPKPKISLIGTQLIKVNLSAGRYSSSKHIKSVFNYPSTVTTKELEITKKIGIC